MRIVLERLSRRFGDRAVVEDLSLEVRSGEMLALLGSSGSGKSTLLSMIAGLLVPDTGRIHLGDILVNDPAVLVPARGRRVGMIFQELALWPNMTVRQHVHFVAPKEDPRPLLRELELEARADSRPASLSGGEAQRLAIARAIAIRPSILLLDEPLGPLDRRLKEATLDLIRRVHRTRGTTSIYVTHDYEEALRLADRVAVMTDGRIAQIGPPSQVYDRPVSEEAARLTGPVNVWEQDGRKRWARPESMQFSSDESGEGVVRGSRYLGGRWEIEVEIDGRTLRGYGPGPLSGRVRVRWNE
jgi:ABC-type Fe3+/spermidine/putrescine transport system ATPase subunit